MLLRISQDEWRVGIKPGSMEIVRVHRGGAAAIAGGHHANGAQGSSIDNVDRDRQAPVWMRGRDGCTAPPARSEAKSHRSAWPCANFGPQTFHQDQRIRCWQVAQLHGNHREAARRQSLDISGHPVLHVRSCRCQPIRIRAPSAATSAGGIVTTPTLRKVAKSMSSPSRRIA